jgi:hypothetical protein
MRLGCSQNCAPLIAFLRRLAQEYNLGVTEDYFERAAQTRAQSARTRLVNRGRANRRKSTTSVLPSPWT